MTKNNSPASTEESDKTSAAPVAEPSDELLPLPAIQSLIDIVKRIKAAEERWEGGWSGTVPNCEDLLLRLDTVSAIWRRRNADYLAVVEQCSRLAALASQPSKPESAEQGAAALDQFHRHEALDRSSLFMNMIAMYLIDHPFVKADAGLHELVQEAAGLLADAYQKIGASPAPRESKS